ncbi:putative transcription factor NAM family [Rosa chinensis]|uniref:Putative transcription factor NAM family n=1 Tax=Rosa chinensis TaxID=74649 RepID=A0A2P6RBA2_ROSCH|nr:putative transcription factor NAM family [Rosa chinensis]
MEGNSQEMSADEYFRSLPPGYRFNPTDGELILNYLNRKILNQPLPRNRIHDINIYQYHPQELSKMFDIIREDGWYFFSKRDRKYLNGTRPNRAARGGRWKATGSEVNIIDENGELIGHKKVLEFKKGRHKQDIKTEWKMHEYRIKDEKEDIPRPKRKKGEGNMQLDTVLCKIYLNTRGNGNTDEKDAVTTETSDQGIMVTDAGTSHDNDISVLKQGVGQVQPLDSLLMMSSMQPQVHNNTTGGFNNVDRIPNSSTIPDCFYSSTSMNNGIMVTDTVTSHDKDISVLEHGPGQLQPLGSSLMCSLQPQVHTIGGFKNMDHISNSSTVPNICFYSSNSMNGNMVTDTVTFHDKDISVLKQGAGQVQPLGSSLMCSLQPQVHNNTTGGFNNMYHISNSSTIPDNCFYSSTPMSNGVCDSTQCTHHGGSMTNGASGSGYRWGSFTHLHHQNYKNYSMSSEQMPSSSTWYPSEHPLQYPTEIWTQSEPENHEMPQVDDSTSVSLPARYIEYESMLVNKEEADIMPVQHANKDEADDDGLQFLSIPDEVHKNDSKLASFDDEINSGLD